MTTDSKSDPYLYHYTSPEGLIGILEAGTIWATSLFYLNDSAELLTGLRVARQILEKMRDDSPGQIQRERLDWLLKELQSINPGSISPTFVCSFSRRGDQLSQWRAYCRGGGYALGFPEDLLREVILKNGFELRACVYVEDLQQELIRGIIERHVLNWIDSAALAVKSDESRFLVAQRLGVDLIGTSSYIKHSSFSEEEEVRCVSPFVKLYDSSKRYYRAGRGMVIPYTCIDLPKDSGIWNKAHIVVGPAPFPDASKAAAYALFRRYYGHAVAVSISTTPYREW